MTKVISAKSLLPNLYENDSSSDDDDNEQEESMSIEDESQSAMTGTTRVPRRVYSLVIP